MHGRHGLGSRLVQRLQHAVARHVGSFAAPEQLPQRSAAHADLDLLFAQLDDLRDIADDPRRACDDDVVYDFSIRWGTMLCGRLQRLNYYERRGELAPDERARMHELVRRFDAARPALERLGLPQPRTPLHA